MTVYLRIIKSEDVEWTGEYNNCLEGEITEYTDLERISRPWRNGTGNRREERIEITHEDGTTEIVEGAYMSSGLE